MMASVSPLIPTSLKNSILREAEWLYSDGKRMHRTVWNTLVYTHYLIAT